MDGVDLDTLDVEANEARTADPAADPIATVDDGGYRSVRAGPLPERHLCSDAEAEVDIVDRVIRESSSSTTTPSSPPTLVLARTRPALASSQARLRARGLIVASDTQRHGGRR